MRQYLASLSGQHDQLSQQLQGQLQQFELYGEKRQAVVAQLDDIDAMLVPVFAATNLESAGVTPQAESKKKSKKKGKDSKETSPTVAPPCAKMDIGQVCEGNLSN